MILRIIILILLELKSYTVLILNVTWLICLFIRSEVQLKAFIEQLESSTAGAAADKEKKEKEKEEEEEDKESEDSSGSHGEWCCMGIVGGHSTDHNACTCNWIW